MPVQLCLSVFSGVECGPKLMANAEHLRLLRQGVEVWNAWRAKEPTVPPDLSGADLSNALLSGLEADLGGANLTEANLSGADLGRA